MNTLSLILFGILSISLVQGSSYSPVVFNSTACDCDVNVCYYEGSPVNIDSNGYNTNLFQISFTDNDTFSNYFTGSPTLDIFLNNQTYGTAYIYFANGYIPTSSNYDQSFSCNCDDTVCNEYPDDDDNACKMQANGVSTSQNAYFIVMTSTNYTISYKLGDPDVDDISCNGGDDDDTNWGNDDDDEDLSLTLLLLEVVLPAALFLFFVILTIALVVRCARRRRRCQTVLIKKECTENHYGATYNPANLYPQVAPPPYVALDPSGQVQMPPTYQYYTYAPQAAPQAPPKPY